MRKCRRLTRSYNSQLHLCARWLPKVTFCLVDLLRSYSNRSDLLTRLREARDMAGERGLYEHLAPTLAVEARPVKVWRVRDRLTDDDARVLIATGLRYCTHRFMC